MAIILSERAAGEVKKVLEEQKVAALVAGFWSVLFGLPSARVKGFYLIMTTMAAQFVTVEFIITQYVSQIGGRGHYFSLPPGTIAIGPIVFGDRENDIKVYYLMLVLVIACTVFLSKTPPVGFEGLLTMMAFVLGVASDLSSSMSGTNPLSFVRE